MAPTADLAALQLGDFSPQLDTIFDMEVAGGKIALRLVKADPGGQSGRAGGAFSLFGGQITGRNVELIPDRRIVQAWRPASWPEGVYSIARFELQAQGAGTRMVFDHTGSPPRLREHLASGWQEHYFGPLKKTFAQ